MNFKPNTMYAAIYRGSQPHKQVTVVGVKIGGTKAYIIEDQRHHLIVDTKDLKSFQQQGKRTKSEEKLLKGGGWI